MTKVHIHPWIVKNLLSIDLGIFIDKYLNWKTHIDLIILKISKAIGIIDRLRHFVPLSVKTKLYQSLIYPYLTYEITVHVVHGVKNLS